MRGIYIFATVIVALLFAQTTVAQTTEEKQGDNGFATEQISTTPTATVTFKTQSSVSPMIAKIRILCDGDDVITEMVCAEIYKRKDIQIKDIIGDEEYAKMSTDEQQVCVSEEEVIEIINRLKK